MSAEPAEPVDSVGPVVVAVDFGASSIRVCRVALGSSPPRVDVVHRYRHEPIADSHGHLRWDWAQLVSEMERGLVAAAEVGPVASIGIDTWAVDYGLLDDRDRLIAPPFSYRDRRTDAYREVVARVGEERLYAITGVQLQPFNTLFQVAVHDRDELARARRLLLLPELLVHHLTGETHAERTSAGSTALVDISTGDWSDELCEEVGLDRSLLVDSIEPATTPAGSWRGIPVHLVGGHDTASAVAAMGAEPGPATAFVSSGTWLLVGRERPEPDLSEGARLANFTNEMGAVGGVRFLKNLAGWWLVEGCRKAWDGKLALDDLLAAAANAEGGSGGLVDVTDERFLNPQDMLGEVTAAAGLGRDAPPAVVVRRLVDSMAASTAEVIRKLVPRRYLTDAALRSRNRAPAGRGGGEGIDDGIDEVYVFGGGTRAALYRERLAERAGVPVIAGPVEATALGNALVQGIAVGRFPDLATARRSLSRGLSKVGKG